MQFHLLPSKQFADDLPVSLEGNGGQTNLSQVHCSLIFVSSLWKWLEIFDGSCNSCLVSTKKVVLSYIDSKMECSVSDSMILGT